MRLLNSRSFQLTIFDDEAKIPQYAILSHTWGEDEVSFNDLVTLSRRKLQSKAGFQKVKKCCSMARQCGLEWVWLDTCCIEQSSSAELSQAINSMFQWYKRSSVCYAYLSDVISVEQDFLLGTAADAGYAERFKTFEQARWFTRGWCLQELLAPRNMQFYNTDWEFIGSKYSLTAPISRITGIDHYGMLIPDLSVLSVAHRMSWAAKRQTTRPEDIAYCLLGIFNINIPLLYGEGQARAFIRLQEEIIRRTEDVSVFAWNGEATDFGNDMVGFLATHPSAFSYGKVDLCDLPERGNPLSITGRGIEACVPLIRQGTGENYLAALGCHQSGAGNVHYAIPVTPLKKTGDIYRRRAAMLQTVTYEDIKNAPLSKIFLLRQSKATHLEDKDTIQIWFSLLEMKHCVYRIQGAHPPTKWNPIRRVFAFSQLDWEQNSGELSAAVSFSRDGADGFALLLSLDLVNSTSAVKLIKFDHAVHGSRASFELQNKLSTTSMTKGFKSSSRLTLGKHVVAASVERSCVYEQDLYEVRVMIGPKSLL